MTLSLNHTEAESPAPLPTASHVNPELCQVAYEFGKYLASLPNKTATTSQACKQVYLSYPSAREILTRHGKLRGLINSFATRRKTPFSVVNDYGRSHAVSSHSRGHNSNSTEIDPLPGKLNFHLENLKILKNVS